MTEYEAGRTAHDDADVHTSNQPAEAHAVAGAKHTFPGGTTNFLREDGTFASPTASVGVKQTEVDFGAAIAVSEQTFTVVDAGVSATSRVLAWLSTDAPTGRDQDDVLIEEPMDIRCTAGAGQFDMQVRSPGFLNDKYKINYLIGAP